MESRPCRYLLAAGFAALTSAAVPDVLEPVCGIAVPSPTVAGAPRKSDVCFSPRWPRKRPGGDPLEMAKRFHATRLEWVYLGNAAAFCRDAAALGMSVCGSVNSNLPDNPTGNATYEVGRARDLDGNRVIPGFMRDWECYWGCANNPEFRRIWLEHAELQLRVGAVRIQNDGPRLTEGGMQHWGGCYCEHCIADFRRFLARTRPLEQLQALGIAAVEDFDYAAYLRGHRLTPPADAAERARAADLRSVYQDFQRASVLAFYTTVHEELARRVGRLVPFSCNNAEGFLLYLHRVHDFAMFEAYPDREGLPSVFYRERILPFRRLGKSFVTTFVSDDVPHTRRYIAQSYAFGQHVIAPWDVFTGAKSPRVFGEPADYADLYGFVRGNPDLFDGYEEAAVTGPGLTDARYEDAPPLRVRGGSRRVCAVVRARPGRADATVVVHLVEWAAEPEPFTVVLDPGRFFGNRALRVRLFTPAPYDADAHARALGTMDLTALTLQRECEAGRRTHIDVPPLRPWGLLVVEPAAVRDGSRQVGLWEPMIWADPASYFTEQLRIRLRSVSPDTVLRFTLDGREPDENAPRYTTPITVTDTAVVQARAFAVDGRPGPVARAPFRRLEAPDNRVEPDSPALRGALELWLAADTLEDSHRDGDAVARWPARVGPDAAATPVTLLDGATAAPPLYRANRANDRPVVAFTDPTHHLDIPAFAADRLAGRRFTVFMVSRADDPQFGFSGNARSGSGGVPRLYVTRGALHYDVLRGIPTGAPPGERVVSSYMHVDGRLCTWVNGIERGQRAQEEPVPEFGSGGHLAIPFWGASEFHAGELAELIIYSRPLDEQERVGVEAYLAEKYRIRERPRWR